MTLRSLPPLIRWIPLAAALVLIAWFIGDTLFATASLARSEESLKIVFALSFLLVLFSWFALRSLYQLFRRRRARIPGSRLQARLVMLFLAVTLIPILLFAVFIGFLVDTGVRAVYQPNVEDALSVSADFVRESHRQLRERFLEVLGGEFASRGGAFRLRELRSGMLRLSRIGRLPAAEAEKELGIPTAGLPADGGASIMTSERRAWYVSLRRIPGSAWMEYAKMELPEIFRDGAAQISGALGDYRQIRRLRGPIQLALIYIALVVGVLAALAVVLTSVRLSRKLTQPINALSEATQRIAAGDLDYRVPVSGQDELADLVIQFNRMGEEMKQNRRRLFHAERLAAWQEVARRLAHEIRNPLTPIQLAAERVLRQSRKGVPDISRVIEHSLPAIISEVETIRNLVAEFATFARLPGKRPEIVELNGFLAGVVAGLGEEYPGTAVLFHPAPEALEVRFDGDQLRRMVGNLVRNGMQSIPPGCEYGLVQLVLEKEARLWRLIVSDNGRGISPADQDRVFTPYFSGREGGSGLGLAIVEKIVIDHGGRIGFKSVPDSGTDFTVEFPITEGERL